MAIIIFQVVSTHVLGSHQWGFALFLPEWTGHPLNHVRSWLLMTVAVVGGTVVYSAGVGLEQVIKPYFYKETWFGTNLCLSGVLGPSWTSGWTQESALLHLSGRFDLMKTQSKCTICIFGQIFHTCRARDWRKDFTRSLKIPSSCSLLT